MESTNQGVTPIKIIIVGSNKTGKTCFMKRWIENKFPEKYIQTEMFQVTTKYYGDKIKGNDKHYHIQIIELVCTKEWEEFTKDFVKDVDGMILLVDATNTKTRDE